MYPRHVLIVEDNPSLPLLIEQWLRRAWGAHAPEVHTAQTLREALEMLQDQATVPPIDALIIDCKLLDAVGLEAPIQLIRAMPHNKAVLPVTILTGTLQQEERHNAYRHGVQEYLSKDRPDLREELPEALLRSWHRYKFYQDGFDILRKPTIIYEREPGPTPA